MPIGITETRKATEMSTDQTTPDTEREYDVSCLIELYGETPADAVATYLAVVRDFLAGRIEWLSVDTVDRETGERTTVRVTPHDVPALDTTERAQS